MTAPTTLFIDTSILRRFSFNFRSRDANALMESIQHPKLTLLLPEITEEEVDRQIEKQVNEVKVSLKAARKKAFILDKHESYQFSIGGEHCVLDKLKDYYLSDWKEFLGSFQVKRLPVTEIDLHQTLHWWKNYEPPFSLQKPSEFKDAFVASNLLKYHSLNDTPIAVLSSDRDWEGFCEGRENFVFFENVLSYAEALNPDVENILSIKNAISKSEIAEEKIRDLILKSSFKINLGWDAIIHKIEKIDLNFQSFSVLNFSQNQAEIAFKASPYIELDLEYTDVAIDEYVLESPEQFRTLYGSGAEITGLLSVVLDTSNSTVTDVLHAEIDQEVLPFP